MSIKISGVSNANSFMDRLMGLMFRKGAGGGLLIKRCRGVHTCFMRFDIDIIFIDRDFVVVGVLEGVRPWKTAIGGSGVEHTLELGSGGADKHSIKVGCSIDFIQ